MKHVGRLLLVTSLLLASAYAVAATVPSIADQKPNTWVKRSPLPGGPPSPRLGYESSWAYDPVHGKMIRWGAHDPGGGGPQLSETWTFDLNTCRWDFVRTNNNPPGNCCCRESVFDCRRNLFVRFSYPAFGHGWFWDRSRYLREDTVWTFDLGARRWIDMRPGRGPGLNVGKPAFYDAKRDIIWVYDTKLRTYDPYTNRWKTANMSEAIGKRTYAGMALDLAHDSIVLFGDHYQSDPRTWVYDIAKDRWTDMKPKVHPPGIRSCPTMVYDSLNRRMILVTLADRWDTKDPAKRRMETWTYNLARNEWTKMNPPREPDYSGTRGRLMRYLPDRNIVILEGRTSREQQIWTYRLAATPPPEPPVPTPTGLSLTSSPGNATDFFKLTWRPVPRQVELAGYHVYRADVEPGKPWQVTFRRRTRKPITATQFSDGIRQFPRRIGRYRVTAVSKDGRESAPSRQLRTQPRLIINSRVDVLARNKVVFSWEASKDKGVLGYVVERAVLRPISAAQKIQTVKQYAAGIDLGVMVERAALGQFVRLTPQPIKATSFTDTVDLSKKATIKKILWQPWFGSKGLAGATTTYDMKKPGCPFAIYAYRVRTVGPLGFGNEGGDSPYQMTVPNEVEDLWSKEEGQGVRLRWSPSPHKGMKGYLVYRLNGRFVSPGCVVQLTPQPIRETKFFDRDAGGRSRRYYVVVVDALGQQGLPSHAVWGFRPWRRHYAPWLPKDGWHQ